MSYPTLKQQASRGAFWALGSNLSVSALSFGGTVVLSRLLEPADFGLMSMAVLVTGVVGLFSNFGLGAALVQKVDVTQEDLSTVFWINCVAGLSLAVLCVLCAPMAGLFFHEDSVKWILICLSVTFILSSVSSIHSTLVYKNVQMKPMAVIEVSGRLLRVVVMLIAAVCGLKVWSIVIGIVSERVFKTMALCCLSPWYPSRVFSATRFKAMFRFGRHLFGGGVLGYLSTNIDFIVTGRILGSHSLGYYQMAYNLPNLLQLYINDSIGAVAFPIFCKVQDDNACLAGGFMRIVRFVAMSAFPVLSGLSFVAGDFILVAYGEKWLPAVQPLRILCFSAALACVNTAVGPLLNAKGRPDIGFKWGFIRLPLTVVGILVGVYIAGIVGVAWGMLVAEILSLVVVYKALKLLKCSILEYAKALLPAATASVIMMGALGALNYGFSLNTMSAWMRLVLECAVGAMVYGAVFVFGFRNILKDLIRTVGFMN